MSPCHALSTQLVGEAVLVCCLLVWSIFFILPSECEVPDLHELLQDQVSRPEPLGTLFSGGKGLLLFLVPTLSLPLNLTLLPPSLPLSLPPSLPLSLPPSLPPSLSSSLPPSLPLLPRITHRWRCVRRHPELSSSPSQRQSTPHPVSVSSGQLHICHIPQSQSPTFKMCLEDTLHIIIFVSLAYTDMCVDMVAIFLLSGADVDTVCEAFLDACVATVCRSHFGTRMGW